MKASIQVAAEGDTASAPDVPTVESLAGVSMDDMVAELEALDEGEDAPSVDPETEPETAEVEDEPQDSDDESDDEADADGEEAEGDDEADDEEGEAEEPEAVDDATQSKLDKLMEAERRGREAVQKEREAFAAEMQKEREAFAAERTELEKKVKAAESTSEQLQSILRDPVGRLLDMGLKEDDLQLLSEDAWAAFRAAKGDPAYVDKARQRATNSRYSTELDATKAELAELKQWREETEKAKVEAAELAKQEESVTAFIDTAAKAATDETPIVSRWLKSDGNQARAALRAVASKILADTDEIPDPADVVKELEKLERQNLKARGIDPDAVATPSKTPASASKKRTAKTLSTKSVSSTRKSSKKPKTLDEEANDVLVALESGILE